MLMRRLAAVVLTALLSVTFMQLGAPVAMAHGRCIVHGGMNRDVRDHARAGRREEHAPRTTGFVPTILDIWAFPLVLPAPAERPFVPSEVCPEEIGPTLVSPMVIPVVPVFVDPPAPGQPSSGSSPADGAPQQPGRILAAGAVPPHDTVADLARTPTRYDRQVVSVTGTVAGYEERFTDRDVRYAEFRLEEGGASIPVVVWGHPGLQPGLRVRVTGTFHDQAPFALAGGSRPHDLLEAQVVARP
jgi:hypothetical protein